MQQQIRFCTSADGVQIAYATYAEHPGTPLLEVNGWGNSQELCWTHPRGRASYEALGQRRRLITFDRRGHGASQREVDDFSLEAHVADVAAIADHLQLEHFDLFGHGDGAAVCVAYAAAHPERVSRLALWSPCARGDEVLKPEAARSMAELIRTNWPLARRALADVNFPSGPPDMRSWRSDHFRECVSPEVAAKYVEFSMGLDIRPLLGQVQAPTLVLHRRGSKALPSRAAEAVAALIPDARFVVLEGDWAGPIFDNLDDLARFAELICQFLDEGGGQGAAVEPAPLGLATILFTDIESSTVLRQRLGDARAQELVRTHNTIVRDALKSHGGSEIKHTGDGIMASFPTASGALECAVAIQRGVAAHVEQHPDAPLGVYIGLNAGEPISEEKDLFGTSVDLARRICDNAQPGQILVSDLVAGLAAGKGFVFADQGEASLKGFDRPVRLYEVRWREVG